ncbi:hypothetical protein BDR26DRAFT_817910 [Obelidium mucronatum]|nr:hypothetical protein BDR26DRAFT_817910 [Obelidium mucronatum]
MASGDIGNFQIRKPSDTLDDSGEQDEFNKRIQRTGCFKEHNAMLDCHFESKDWRKCALEMRQFRECFAAHEAQRRQRSVAERAREAVVVERDADGRPAAGRNPFDSGGGSCELPQGYAGK